ncbi:MAG: hypothetical protein WBP46_15500 [Thiolinea sp.]|nr:hypothetical protein [Thiolinea sp.]
MSKKKPRLKLPSRTNPIARAAIMSKGGAHQKTRSAERQADKRQLRQLVAKVGADSGPADLAA